MSSGRIRNLVVVLGDQLDRETFALGEDFDRRRDAVWMAEVTAEARHVPSHKARIALFLSAMRHFRRDVEADGYRVLYRELGRGDDAHQDSLARALGDAI